LQQVLRLAPLTAKNWSCFPQTVWRLNRYANQKPVSKTHMRPQGKITSTGSGSRPLQSFLIKIQYYMLWVDDFE